MLCLKTRGWLYKGKGERTEYWNYRDINLLNVAGKIYAWMLVDRFRRRNDGLTDDEQVGFSSGSR